VSFDTRHQQMENFGTGLSTGSVGTKTAVIVSAPACRLVVTGTNKTFVSVSRCAVTIHERTQQCTWYELGTHHKHNGKYGTKTCFTKFYNLLTLHPGMILVNNQLDAQFFIYFYFYSLHVSGSHVPIIRRIIVSMRHLVYVTLCRWPSGV